MNNCLIDFIVLYTGYAYILKEFGINEAEWRKLATKPELWKKMLKEKEIELNKKWRLNQIKMRKERKERRRRRQRY